MTPPEQRRLRKLPARYASIVMPLVLSALMSFVVSGTSTLKAVGITPGFPSSWMAAWIISWIVAYPTLLVVLPIVRRIVGLLVDLPENRQ